VAEAPRIAAALRYQQEMDAAQRPATMNPNIAAQGATGRALVAPPTSVMDERYPAWKKSQDDAENLMTATEMIGAAIPLAGPAVKGAAALGRYAGPELARGLENYMGRTGMMLNVIKETKTGNVPKNIASQKINNPSSEWRNSDLLQFANPNATSALVRGNPNMTIKELSDGNLLLEHSPIWGSTEKPFYMVGNDVGELVKSAIPRLERSNIAVSAANKSKFDNSLIGKLTAEYGDTFSTAKSGRSESNYITHEPSGTKIRISEHNLPLGYVQPDVDLRVGQSLDEQLTAIRKALGQ
jgi:hypothetical protein